jgi:hypothetical protein
LSLISLSIIEAELSHLDAAIRILMRAEAAIEALKLAKGKQPGRGKLAYDTAKQAFAQVAELDFQGRYGGD